MRRKPNRTELDKADICCRAAIDFGEKTSKELAGFLSN